MKSASAHLIGHLMDMGEPVSTLVAGFMRRPRLIDLPFVAIGFQFLGSPVPARFPAANIFSYFLQNFLVLPPHPLFSVHETNEIAELWPPGIDPIHFSAISFDTKPKHNPQIQSQSHPVMKPYIPYSILAAALACGMAQAVTSYTTPVGYVSLGSPTGDAVPAQTDMVISLPLSNASVYAGAVLSSTATTIDFSGSPFASLNLTATPHVVEITSGLKQGLLGLIMPPTTSSQITVVSTDGTDFSTLGTATVSIRPAVTVGSLMASAAVPISTQFQGYTGTTAGINVAPDVILEWDGTNWIDLVTTGEPADNTVLYPGESFIIRNSSLTTAIPSLVMTGDVLANKLLVRLENLNTLQDQDIPTSYASSVPETVADSGLTPLANVGDQINITDSTVTGIYKSASVILEYDGANWIDLVTTGEPAETSTYIGGGNGFTFRRKATASISTWSQSPTYIPSL